MKASVPDPLKSDLPPTRWGKILGVTPVVMTVVATLLAGLASSEMTRAQYDRAFAAQLQAKVGDQWNFYQGKKLRGALEQNTLDLIAAGNAVRPLRGDELAPALAERSGPGNPEAAAALTDGTLPAIAPAPAFDPRVQAALDAVDNFRPDEETTALVARVPKPALDEALRDAEARSLAFDAVDKPVSRSIAAIERRALQPGAEPGFRRNFLAARIGYDVRRYDAEARLNQVIATLYELQVRKSNLSAERHHDRSQKFFYGMLAAQMGVVISTLAMAARQRSLLWAIAAAAGLAAIAFAIYVYLCV